MNLGVISSLALILLVVYVPYLQTIFKTEALGLSQWLEILPLLIIPSLAAELTKTIYLQRKRG
jgi:Ca2+-transporting ATPase